MTPERMQQIEAVFHDACDLAPDERTAFLAQACAGDEDLRCEVESLLTSDEQAGTLIETPAYEMAAPLLLESQSPAFAAQSISHYQIIALLGKGGMGEVYQARDTRLDRTVALKILPADVATNAERLRRFVREAKAASALNHPHVATIYEIGEAENVNFIAMEYVEGQTLAARINGQPLAIQEVVDISLQIADALDEAHRKGIIHRDIKSANVMLTPRRQVKVLDFGLAKIAQPQSIDSDISTLAKTQSGVVMGTVPYMSPEQALGREIDHRSDLFSLGVVLYEMVTGRLPFAGASTSEILDRILHAQPEALARFNYDVPAELERIVNKALRKDREQRYQTGKDLLIDLKDLQHKLEFAAASYELEPTLGAHAPRVPLASASEANNVVRESAEVEETPSRGKRASIPSLAAREARAHLDAARSTRLRFALIALAPLVLLAVAAFFYFKRQPVLTDKDTILLADFVNTTGDAAFDSTLKQALAVHLGQSPFLNLFADERVREILRLMNRSPDERITSTVAREICQRQGLKALLTGTIASLGRNYVISLEAVDAQTGDVLAREQGEAEGKEQVLRTLGEAADKMREKLGESLSSIQKFDALLEQATTFSLEALKDYALADEQNWKGKYFEAISSLQHAIELDPNFARAYSNLAAVYNNSGQPGLAAEAAQKAFELRERVSEREKLHITDQYYSKALGDLTKSIEAMQLCIQKYPRDVFARNNLGYRYNALGRYEEAMEEFRVAIRLNPNYGNPYLNLILASLRLNRFEEARAMSEQALAQKFEFVEIHAGLYAIAFINGDTAAMKQQVDWASARPGEYAHLNWQAGAAAFAGQWQQAQELSNRAAELTRQRNLQETAGEIVSSNAEWAAILGQCQQSRIDIARAIALPRTPTSLFRAGMALALCGNAAQAQALNDEAVKRYPQNTLVNEINLPLIRAAIELQRGNRTQAIQILQPVSRYERVSNFYQNYLRGQAYLGERNGTEAVSEFQKILDHRGWAPTSPLYPLAHLGLARATLLQGDTAKARKFYQDFFALWKDADADLPILLEAKKEYEKLK